MDVDGLSPDEHEPDLERIAGDLADVERALERLDDGSYWADEVTGEQLSDELLAGDPTARRTAYIPGQPRSDTDEPPPLT
jgi:RNA polymerase-binding transcription factor DksA